MSQSHVPVENFCKAIVEDRTIYFQLLTPQLYGEGEKIIPIHWEENCQVFIGEMELDDILSLDIKPE